MGYCVVEKLILNVAVKILDVQTILTLKKVKAMN